ncbi:hypothetical protein VNI00_017036, partial [Paramarasmius palmivorus]
AEICDTFEGILDSILPPFYKEYGDLLRKHGLHLGKDGSKRSDPAEVSNWLAAKVNNIKETSEYKSHTEDKAENWDKSLDEKIRNWKNNVFIPECQHAFIKKWQGLESGDGDATVPLQTGAARDLLASLREPATARDLFVRENVDAISAKRRELLEAGGSVKRNGGGAHAKAVKILWEEADRKSYEMRVAQGDAVDITKNRMELPQVLYECMKDLCVSGQLGTLELFMMFGYRSEKDSAIDTGRIRASTIKGESCFDGAHTETLWPKVDAAWKSFVATKIPPLANQVKLCEHLDYNNEDAAFIKPGLQIYNTAPDSLRAVLKNLFEALYYKEYSIMEVPYDKLQKDPGAYYDVTAHSYLASLGSLDPQDLAIGSLYGLAEYLQKVTPPFMFLERSPKAASQELSSQSESSKHAATPERPLEVPIEHPEPTSTLQQASSSQPPKTPTSTPRSLSPGAPRPQTPPPSKPHSCQALSPSVSTWPLSPLPKPQTPAPGSPPPETPRLQTPASPMPQIPQARSSSQ